MNNNFKQLLDDSLITESRNLDNALDLANRLSKILRKGGVLQNQALKIDPGFKKELADLEKKADNLLDEMDSVFGEIMRAGGHQ